MLPESASEYICIFNIHRKALMMAIPEDKLPSRKRRILNA